MGNVFFHAHTCNDNDAIVFAIYFILLFIIIIIIISSSNNNISRSSSINTINKNIFPLLHIFPSKFFSTSEAILQSKMFMC